MNISQFSKYAGVSKSAVSRYFNQGYLSEDKKKQIEKAIKETGYHPSISAQSVKTRITKLVGVILPKLSSESTAKIVEGISSVLGEQGYELLLVNTANDYEKEIKYLDLFRKNRVDGVIFLASVFTDLHRTILKKMHIPVVIVGQKYEDFTCIYHNDFEAAYQMTEHLIKQGAKRIAYIGATEKDYAVGFERKRGYQQALCNYHLETDPDYCLEAEFSMDSAYHKAKYLLRKKPIDAIFCATDMMAAGVITYCRENEYKIPEDLMVAGIGDSKVSRALSLSTVSLNYHQAGVEAANCLLLSLHSRKKSSKEGPKKGDNGVQMGVELIPRSSTKCETL